MCMDWLGINLQLSLREPENRLKFKHKGGGKVGRISMNDTDELLDKSQTVKL